jgi:hypothetical protein
MFNATQWAFNYTSAGVTAIQFYAKTGFATSLTIRAAVDGTGGRYCTTNGVVLPNDGNWHLLSLSFTATDLSATNPLGGSSSTAGTLANVTALRLLSNPAISFAGQQIAATVSYDRISYTNNLPTLTPTLTATPTQTLVPTATWTPDARPLYLYVGIKGRASLQKVDPLSGKLLGALPLHVDIANNFCTGILGLAYSRVTGKYFVLMTMDTSPYQGSGRALGEVDMNNGYVKFLAWIYDYAASLAVDNTGQLWTVIGNNNNDHVGYLAKLGMDGGLNLVTGGIQNSDVALSYNWDDNSLYVASGYNASSFDAYSLGQNMAYTHVSDFSVFQPGKATALSYVGGGNFYFGMSYDIYSMTGSTGAIFQTPVYTQGYDYVKGIAASHDNFNWSRPVPVGKFIYDIEQGTGNTLRKVDPQTGLTLQTMPVALTPSAGGGFYNITGMDLKPGTTQVYVIYQQARYDSSRTLGTLNLGSGYITPISPTGAAVSNIAFDAAGNLFGTVGLVAGTGYAENDIVRINLSNAALTRIVDAMTQDLNFRNYDTSLAYNPGDGALYFSTYYHSNYYRIFASPTAVVTPVAENLGYESSNWGPAATSLSGGWMLTTANDFLSFFSQNGDNVHSGIQLDHNPKAMFLAGAMPLQTLTPTLTPAVAPSNTPTPTATATALPGYSWPAGKRIYVGIQDVEIHEMNPLVIDPINGSVSRVMDVSVVDEVKAFAKDPTTGIYYIVDYNGGGTRSLYTLDIHTGVPTLVGPTGDYLNSITFDSAGNMYGTVGNNGGALQNDVVSVDKATGALTQIVDVTDPVNGNTMSYRPQDGFLYVFESDGSVLTTVRKVSVNGATNITFTVGAIAGMTGQVQASAVLPDGNFLVTDSTGFNVISPTGVFVGHVMQDSTYSSLRGMMVSDLIANFGLVLTPTPAPPSANVIFGAERDQPYLVVMDATTGAVRSTIVCTGFNFDGFTGLAWNPVEEKLYGVVQIGGLSTSNRHLVSIDPTSGATTDIASVANYIAGIAFTDQGTLYGVEGNGGGSAGAIVVINAGTGVESAPVISPGGTCGVTIAYDAGLARLFKLDGCNWNHANSIDLTGPSSTAVPFTRPNINSDVLGATSESTGHLLVSLFNSDIDRFDTSTGVVSVLTHSGYYFKGLALVPLSKAPAQVDPTPTPTPTGQSLLVAENFGNTLKVLDLGTMSYTLSYPLNVSSAAVIGLTGLAKDPNSTKVYALAELRDSQNNTQRNLLSLDLATGSTVNVGNIGYMAGLAFDGAGDLVALAGNNSCCGGQIMSVDTNTAATTQLTTYSIGSGGMSIAWDPANSQFYSMQGSNGGGMQRYDAAGNSIGASTSITLPDPSAPGENLQMAVYQHSGQFLVAFGDRLYRVDDASGVGTSLGYLPSRIKGAAFISGVAIPTAVPTATRTATPVLTSTPSQTPKFGNSGADHSIVGPVPAKRDQPICLYFPAQPISSKWTVFNSAGEKVASLSFGSESSQCWDHVNVAPGIYFVSLEVETAAGKEKRVQKVAIVP